MTRTSALNRGRLAAIMMGAATLALAGCMDGGGSGSDGSGGDGGGDDKDALLAKAKDLGVAVKGTWGVDRLKSEIEAAEKAKTDSAN